MKNYFGYYVEDELVWVGVYEGKRMDRKVYELFSYEYVEIFEV